MTLAFASLCPLGLALAFSRLTPAAVATLCVVGGPAASLSFLAGWPRVGGMRSPVEPPLTVHIPTLVVGLSLLLG